MATLQELFKKFMLEYSNELAIAKRTVDYKRPFGNLVRQDIAGMIRTAVDTDIYKVKGSVGAGRWTDVPWIAVFDKRITESAQKGVYIVYLLNKDTKELYLTLNQGATDVSQRDKLDSNGKLSFTGIASADSDKTTRALKYRANSIRKSLNNMYGLSIGEIKTGSKAYDAGCICYKKYTLSNLPNDEELYNDLDTFIAIYKDYYDIIVSGKSAVSKDSQRRLTKEQWLEVLNNKRITHDNNLEALACMYDNGGKGSCSEIEQKYGIYMAQIRTGLGVYFASRVVEFFGIDISGNEKNSKYWPVLFTCENIQDDTPGVFVYTMHQELYEALTEFDITRILKESYPENRGEMKLTTKDIVKNIKDYIAAKGFSYDDGLIENFYLSLKSKPFVILAGTSGTGKTKLVKLFAEAIGAEYKLVSVRPDWSDGSDLFGHYDLNGNFIEGPVCECFDTALSNPDKPVFLCLDEMNLARVEYYLSDFLSVIESREMQPDGMITTTSIAQYAEGIPENLYIIGTVNMDETTFPFSKKVLDRANTIEFSYVDLIPVFDDEDSDVSKQPVSNDILKNKYLVLTKDCADEAEYVSEICSELQRINEILRKANAHVGYRVRDEIVFYMINNKVQGELISHDAALDNEIMQKILPRIQGSSASVKDMLCELFTVCASAINQKTGDSDSEKMQKVLDDSTINKRYLNSAKKIAMMVQRFEEDGFTSYWL